MSRSPCKMVAMKEYVRNQGKLCEVEGCERPAIKKLMCASHYDKKRRRGDPLMSGYSPLPPLKLCGGCNEEKPREDFHRKGRGEARRFLCKPCYSRFFNLRKFGLTYE